MLPSGTRCFGGDSGGQNPHPTTIVVPSSFPIYRSDDVHPAAKQLLWTSRPPGPHVFSSFEKEDKEQFQRSNSYEGKIENLFQTCFCSKSRTFEKKTGFHSFRPVILPIKNPNFPLFSRNEKPCEEKHGKTRFWRQNRDFLNKRKM